MPKPKQNPETLKQFYELRLADCQKLHAELNLLIESGDFSLAAMKARELSDRLEALNSSANELAEVI